jgi:hypothetical protein
LSALDYFLLISLLFIIGTTVEFAIVLVVKQKFELFNTSKTALRKAATAPNSLNYRHGSSASLCRVEPMDNLERETQVYNANALGETNKGNKLVRLCLELPLTKRIDFVAFLIFNIFYFVFNCVYLFIFI